MVTRLIQPAESGWNDIPCPHCGYVETLSDDIIDLWTCDQCNQDFWVLPMLLIASKPRRIEYDAEGNEVAYQMALSDLTFSTDYNRSEDD